MSLLIERVRITTSGGVAFDELFSAGVNVVEGENSSGKSTLFKLMYFGLGGVVPSKQWTDGALKCDRVFIQARIFESKIVISRKIAESGFPSILIFDGDLESALSGSLDEWKEYSYSRSSDKQSYSQLMFSALGMPEAFSDSGDFVTFNQFLRIHYSDQDSPITSLLRYEDQFDKPATREAVGNFILGGSDQKLASLERQLRDAQNAYGQSLASVSAGNILLGSDYNELSASGIDAAERRVVEEIERVEQRLNEVGSELLRPASFSRDDGRLVEITKRLGEARADLSDRLASYGELNLESRDSQLFLSTLRQRLDYLSQSVSAATGIGELMLESCPACGVAVEQVADQHHCYLCKTGEKPEKPEARYFSLMNATRAQIEQSERVQRTRAEHIQALSLQITNARSEVDRLSRELQSQKVTVSTDAQAEFSTLQNRLGFLQGDLDRVRRDRRVVERLDALRRDRDRLAGQITALKEELDRIRNGVTLRLGGALSAVSTEAGELLEADLDRQAEFHDDPHVELDFRGNAFSVNGQKAFSASSVSYLRNAIYLGVLFASLRHRAMRHLKMLMLENLEDKGMEPGRYYNLHRSIVQKSNSTISPHQIIVGTADFAPDLRDQVFLVGRKYTHETKTLRIDVT